MGLKLIDVSNGVFKGEMTLASGLKGVDFILGEEGKKLLTLYTETMELWGLPPDWGPNDLVTPYQYFTANAPHLPVEVQCLIFKLASDYYRWIGSNNLYWNRCSQFRNRESASDFVGPVNDFYILTTLMSRYMGGVKYMVKVLGLLKGKILDV